MKKALIILTACILCLSGAFADIDGAKVEGNATLTYGFDFENETSGFDNETEFTITMPLIANGTTKTTKSSGDSYAEISFKDLGFTMVQTMTEYDDAATDYFGKTPTGDLIIDPDESFFNDQDTMDMSAKLVFKKLYMTVYNRPSFTVNYAQLAQVFDADKWDDDIKFEPGTRGWGTTIGFSQKGIDVAVRVGSYFSYDNMFVPYNDPLITVDPLITDGITGSYGKYLATEHNDYAFGVTAKMTPSEKLTFETSFNTVGDGAAVNAGVSAAFKASPVLKFTGAFDAGNTWNDGSNMDDIAIIGTTKDWGYDALLSGEYTWKKNALIEGGAYFTSGAVDNEFVAGSYEWIPGVQFVENDDGTYTYTRAGNITSFVTLTNKEFIPGVDAKLTMLFPFMLNSGPASAVTYGFQPVIAKFDAGFKTALNDVNYYKPFAKIAYQNYNNTGNKVTWMAFEAGVEYGLFTNTTITGTFTLGETADDAPWITGGYVSTPATGDSGSFTIACKVTY